MSILAKIEASKGIICDVLSRGKRPVVLWSGGKDSQVLLYLLWRIRPSIPVVYFRGFEDAQKHAFAEWVIKHQSLNIQHWTPNARDVIGHDGHVNLLESYQVGDLQLAFPLEAPQGFVPDKFSYCGVEVLNQPVAEQSQQYDIVFIGQRGDDRDGMMGDTQLDADWHQTGKTTLCYPLRHWTEADIWAASALLDIPQNEARYLRGEMEYNPDYWPLCTNCLQPGQDGEMVHCPKVDGEVYNLGKYLNLEERRLAWRRQFVNVISSEES